MYFLTIFTLQYKTECEFLTSRSHLEKQMGLPQCSCSFMVQEVYIKYKNLCPGILR